MVTIQAPGIEINEIDLSQYDTSGQREQTTNVYVTGFASKGLNYSPYKFTYHDTESDLLKVFGAPTNEAERYFMHACKEVISQDKAVLYASRLPYCNKSLSTINCAEWQLSTAQTISVDFQYWLGFVEGSVTLDDLKQVPVYKDQPGKPEVESLSAPGHSISVFARLDNKKSFFYTDFEALENVLPSDDDEGMNAVKFAKKYLTAFIDTTKNGVVLNGTVHEFDGDGIISDGYDNLSGTEFNFLNNDPESEGCAYEFKLLSPITVNNQVVTPCYYRMPYGGLWGNKFGEIYTEDKTMKLAADIKFVGPVQKSIDEVDLYRTGERKPATNRFMIVDKTQAQYDEVPVDKFHKGNNQQLVGIVPVITTAANALYVQKMIDVDEDNIVQLKNYEALGNIHTMVGDADVTSVSSVVGEWQSTEEMFGKTELAENRLENPYLYAENILNKETGEIEPKIYNNILVTPTNSQFLSPDNKNADTMCKIASKLFPFIGKTDTGDYDREYMKHIGVVVFMGIKDPEEGNKVNFKVVESFAGSLKPDAKNSTTGESMFIDDIVNTNSQYIEFYSNCFNGDDNNFYTWDNDHQNESEQEQQQPGADGEQANPCESIVFRSVMPLGAEPGSGTGDDEFTITNYSSHTVLLHGTICGIPKDYYLSAGYSVGVSGTVSIQSSQHIIIKPVNEILDDDHQNYQTTMTSDLEIYDGKEYTVTNNSSYSVTLSGVVNGSYQVYQLDPNSSAKVSGRIDFYALDVILNPINILVNPANPYVDFVTSDITIVNGNSSGNGSGSGSDDSSGSEDDSGNGSENSSGTESGSGTENESGSEDDSGNESIDIPVIKPIVNFGKKEDIKPITPSTYSKLTFDYVDLTNVKDPTNKGTYARPGQKNGIIYNDLDILVANRLDTVCFGFKKHECLKIINVTESISKALDKCFEKMKDVNAHQIDIVCDAGVSNIAQFYTTCNCPKGIFFMDEEDPDRGWYSILETNKEGFNGKMFKNAYKVALNYNPVSPHAVKYWQLSDVSHTEKWKMILRKYDNFCKNVRKDCMFLADGLRPLCVKGNAKIVRKTNFKSTIGNSIAPRIKYMSGAIDTSYGAGYCDWMQIDDRYTGLPMWLPPSIKMVGVYIRSTNNGHYWDAPAGVNRGKLDIRDIAFSPTVDEAAAFYTKNWNYCTFYEDEGNVAEGQKTFQSKPTAFDRVNVRRLFLGLERRVFLAGKYFLYEGNTAYTRQRLIDTITPWFEDAKIKGGCYDYRIQCDELNNTPDTIDRNELHIRIGIKPVKSIEFIDATFVCLRTGGSWTEAGF